MPGSPSKIRQGICRISLNRTPSLADRSCHSAWGAFALEATSVPSVLLSKTGIQRRCQLYSKCASNLVWWPQTTYETHDNIRSVSLAPLFSVAGNPARRLPYRVRQILGSQLLVPSLDFAFHRRADLVLALLVLKENLKATGIEFGLERLSPRSDARCCLLHVVICLLSKTISGISRCLATFPVANRRG